MGLWDAAGKDRDGSQPPAYEGSRFVDLPQGTPLPAEADPSDHDPGLRAAGITTIDTRTAGLAHVTAGYLLDAPRPALIECGPALTVGHVIDALATLGLDPDDLAYLVLTHIHLDHGGGAGDLLAAFPAAHVVVSPLGAPHLADPTKLNVSSRRVYGELMDTVYGSCTPIASTRIEAVEDGATLDLGGGRRLELLATPGHAKHHITPFDHDSGTLFVGDSVGVKLPGMRTIRPATPPADFDYVLAVRALERYRALEPARVLLAHYGDVGDPLPALDDAATQLARWVETAAHAWQEHREVDHIVEALSAAFGHTTEAGAEHLELLNGIRSNAAGLTRYLDLRAEGRTTPATG